MRHFIFASNSSLPTSWKRFEFIDTFLIENFTPALDFKCNFHPTVSNAVCPDYFNRIGLNTISNRVGIWPIFVLFLDGLDLIFAFVSYFSSVDFSAGHFWKWSGGSTLHVVKTSIWSQIECQFLFLKVVHFYFLEAFLGVVQLNWRMDDVISLIFMVCRRIENVAATACWVVSIDLTFNSVQCLICLGFDELENVPRIVKFMIVFIFHSKMPHLVLKIFFKCRGVPSRNCTDGQFFYKQLNVIYSQIWGGLQLF